VRTASAVFAGSGGLAAAMTAGPVAGVWTTCVRRPGTPTGRGRRRATAVHPPDLPGDAGVGTGRGTVRAVRNDVHNPPKAGGRYWPRIGKSIAPSASQAVRHRAGTGPRGGGAEPTRCSRGFRLSAMLLPGTAIHRLPGRRHEPGQPQPAPAVWPIRHNAWGGVITTTMREENHEVSLGGRPWLGQL